MIHKVEGGWGREILLTAASKIFVIHKVEGGVRCRGQVGVSAISPRAKQEHFCLINEREVVGFDDIKI